MPPHNNIESIGWKEYGKLLMGLGAGFVMLAVVVAIFATFLYSFYDYKIEQISHRSLSPVWICLLLWVPIVIQISVFLLLRKRTSQAISNDDVRAYFKFYFFRMACSLLWYNVLWLSYWGVFALGLGNGAWRVLSGLSLIGIVVLVGIVVHATYLITKTSFRDDELLLTEADVSPEHIGTKLKHVITPELRIIRQWLIKDRDCKVHVVALKKEVTYLDVAHLTEALNRLICNRRFYDEITSTNAAQQNSSDRLVPEAANRNYLDKHLLEAAETKSSKSKKEQEKLAEQKIKRDGIAMFPFYTMLFFFSIFLCIAYLFGFAFAFEDKYVQLTDPEKQVALFMTDDLLEDAEQQIDSSLFRKSDLKNSVGLPTKLHDATDPLSIYLNTQFKTDTQKLLKEYDGSSPPSEALQQALIDELNKQVREKSLFEPHRFVQVSLREETKKLLAQQDPSAVDLIRQNRLLFEDAYPFDIVRSQQSVPAAPLIPVLQEVFYFNSGGAAIQIGVANNAPDKDKRFAETNKMSLQTLVRRIREELDDGTILRVELVGRADDKRVGRSLDSSNNMADRDTYASNYDLAAVRIKAVRYQLQRQLIREKVLPRKLAALDWVELPLSNDTTLPAAQRSQDTKQDVANNDSPVLDDGSEQTSTSSQKVTGDLIKALNTKINLEEAPEEVRAFWERLYALAQKSRITQKEMQAIIGDIGKWKDLDNKGQASEAVKTKSQITRELFRLEDLAGSKRVVEVSLYSANRSAQKPSPHFKRMALMDYLYFAMYTITTTGYGDIRPMTAYTKFLCALANMTEIFFIVVFFNTLLSLRRGREEFSYYN
jgi:hypothetical protein